jgi:hypothetical protein
MLPRSFGGRVRDAGCGDDREDPAGAFSAEEVDQADLPRVLSDECELVSVRQARADIRRPEGHATRRERRRGEPCSVIVK